MDAVVDRLLTDRRWFVGFAAVLVLVPVALVVAGCGARRAGEHRRR